MKPAFDIDWRAAPADIVAATAAHATRIETAHRHGTMVWHRWTGPAGAPATRPPLILLHGGFGSWTHWIRNIPTLAARTTVFAADLPGLGDSGDIGRPDNVEPVAGIVADGIDALLAPDARYDLAGFSFGAVVGGHVAALHGMRCRGFTAVGAAGFGRLHHVVQGIAVPDPRLAAAEIDAVHRNNLHLLMLVHEDSIDPLALHIHRRNVERGRLRSRRISLSNALADALPRMHARIGGIWGAQDATAGGPENIKARRKLFRDHQPASRFDVIPDAGHWVMYEAPRAFNGALIEHLDACDRATPAGTASRA